MDLSKKIIDFGKSVEEEIAQELLAIDEIAEKNQLKVINAMQECRLAEDCLYGSTGYGYNDRGREVLESIYAAVFKCEDALVRPLIACGTHALSIALAGNLRPGDELLYISGKPYDTLEKVIGIVPSKGSLAEYGVTYNQVDLTKDGHFDYEGIRNAVNEKTRIIGIQRSRGYSVRPSLTVDEIEDVIKLIREIKEDVIVMVDNCYGEFVEEREPSEVGADLIVGSLIKNPGGGLAPIGGYIAGKAEYVENAAIRLTSPGLGKEVGATINTNLPMLQGLFIAPSVTASACKGAIFASACYEKLNYKVSPGPREKRTDIIQSVTLGSADAVCAFARGIQGAAPVDSFVIPEPTDMPGYTDPVIMAAGTFIQGASIELSADAPMREPYAVYFQGGLTYPQAKLGILNTISELIKEGCISEDNL